MKVGFIGLGSMGAGMSHNLIKAGHDLVVYNRTRSRAQELQSLGAKVADNASEAAIGWKCSSRCWLTITLCKM